MEVKISKGADGYFSLLFSQDILILLKWRDSIILSLTALNKIRNLRFKTDNIAK